MLNRLIEFSLKERLAMAGMLIILAAFGLYALQKIPIDSLPDVTNNQVQVLTEARGLSPVEVEKLVTVPIETALNGLPKMLELRSISKFGLSVVTVVFEDDVDKFFARQLVLERIIAARKALPPIASEPTLGPMSSALGEIYQYQVRGEGKTPMELRAIQDFIVKPQLKTVEGVTEVNSFGGFVKQYHVVVDPLKLQAYRVSLGEVFAAIERGNRIASGNYIEKNQEQYIIRGLGQANAIRDLENCLIRATDNVPIYVRDVAEVRIGEEIRQGAVTRDDEGEIVTGIVMMRRGENSRAVIERIKEKVAALNSALEPQGVKIESFYDQTELVRRTIRTVITNLTEGGLLVVLVLVTLLGNLRAALIVAAVIPLSMLCTFIGMNWLGLSANLMSLGAIDFGMVVDGSVVMMENIVRRIHRKPDEPRLQAILESAKEVSRPIFFGVLIIMMVYVPILSLQGMEGKLFAPMAFAVGFAVLGSLFLALTFVPLASSFALRGEAKERENPLLRWLAPRYAKWLSAVMNRPKRSVGIALAALLTTLALAPFMGGEFVPELEEGNILIELKRLPSITLSESVAQAEKVAAVLKRFPEVKTVVCKTGRPDIANDYMGVQETDVFVILSDKSKWRAGVTKQRLIDEMRKAIAPYAEAMYVNFTQPIAMRVNELVSGSKGDVAVKIFGEDYAKLKQYAEVVEKVAKETEGTAAVLVEQVSGQPYLNIALDRAEMARYGIAVEDVQQVLETAIGGKVATEVLEGQRRIAVVVRLKPSARSDLDAIGNVMIPIPNANAFLPLRQLATLAMEEGPAQVSHERAMRRLVVECNIEGRDLSGYVSELRERLRRELRLETGYFIEYGGQFENQARATARLMLVVPVSVFIIFVLLYAAFGAARDALLVLANLPFALVGGIWALLLRGLPLSVTAAIGFVALFGVAVLNGVVLISYINERRKTETRDLRAVIVEACKARLRPVLMTALVASLGFLPMALSQSDGAEVQRPLATVVIGGLVTSTALTLFVLPTVYEWAERRRKPA
ncbi:MAG: CusA/CzcA family heavy metal efflux RND transporter [Chloroherpetonaceae bacterium]|nr:CusA/CzcA family heavy metal efflux RND transporter [Chloroherpetonaceae bacterium]